MLREYARQDTIGLRVARPQKPMAAKERSAAKPQPKRCAGLQPAWWGGWPEADCKSALHRLRKIFVAREDLDILHCKEHENLLTPGRKGIIFIPAMNFEFDPAKSAANQLKHGVDFKAARELWEDADRLEISVNCTVETRWMLLAQMAGWVWAAVFTRRGDNIRLISVRRAREKEKELYEQTQKEDDGEGI